MTISPDSPVGDLLRGARDVPDADLVDRAVEEPDAAPVEFSALPIAACWMLSDRGGRPTVSSRSSTPLRKSCHLRAVVGRGGVIPDVVLDGGHAGDRVVQARRAAARAFLEVGDQHVAALSIPRK